MTYLTVTAMVKDELDLEEWIAFHLAVGVDHLLIYNNSRSNHIKSRLATLFGNRVTVFHYTGGAQQLNTQQDAIWKCREKKWKSRWLALLDGDEYLFSPTEDLKSVLQDYEEFAALAVNWFIFGSSGHDCRPRGLIMENYLLRQPVAHQHVKSIVDPERTIGPLSPHHCAYKTGFAVNQSGQRVQAHLSPPGLDRIRINHYFLKSREDWHRKLRREMAMAAAHGQIGSGEYTKKPAMLPRIAQR
jgi:hypothetical protein